MKPVKRPSKLDKHMARLPLYFRLVLGAMVVFGMVGNCAHPGDVRPVIVLIFVALFWASTRVLTEALEAWRILRMAHEHDAEQEKEQPKHDEPPPPSEPPTT